jgi:hypothetical protein
MLGCIQLRKRSPGRRRQERRLVISVSEPVGTVMSVRLLSVLESKLLTEPAVAAGARLSRNPELRRFESIDRCGHIRVEARSRHDVAVEIGQLKPRDGVFDRGEA